MCTAGERVRRCPPCPAMSAGQGTVKKRKAVDEDRQKLRDGLQESIVSEKPNVQWSDIAGLEEAKRALRQVWLTPPCCCAGPS